MCYISAVKKQERLNQNMMETLYYHVKLYLRRALPGALLVLYVNRLWF
jgi:hypothetical protein